MLTAIMVTFIAASVLTFITISLSNVEYIDWPFYIQIAVVFLSIFYIFAQGVMVGLKGY